MSEQEPKQGDNETITEESILEAEIESLGMQLDDLRQWFPVILGKENLKMTVEEKRRLADETRHDLDMIRTKFFNITGLGKK